LNNTSEKKKKKLEDYMKHEDIKFPSSNSME